MNTSILQPRRSPPVWLSVVVWLSAFFSPTAYFLLLLLANKFQIKVPQAVAWPLLFLVPVVALVICGSVVWSCRKTVGRKIGWMLFTVLAMLLQCVILLAILRVILVTAIGYA